MWTAIACVLGFGGLVWAVCALSKNYGRVTAHLETAKQIEREREYGNKIIDRVDSMSADDVRQRLRDISGDK